jgi:hypothetical protein
MVVEMSVTDLLEDGERCNAREGGEIYNKREEDL